MAIELELFKGNLYRKVNVLEESKDVIASYLLMFATPEEIKFRAKNLDSLLNIHGELERVLYALPRDLLIKIAKRVEVRVVAENLAKLKKKAAAKKKATIKKKDKKLPI